MRITLIGVIAALALVVPAAHAAGPGSNLNYRSGQVVKHLKACTGSVTLLRQVITAGDELDVSRAASQVKDICDGAQGRIAAVNDKHISDQSLDAQVACDYWERGAGRIVDYVDSRKASDLVATGNHWRRARTISLAVVASINQQRRKFGLPPLKAPSIPAVNF